MKKIFAIVAAALIAVSASAQDCCKKEGQCCGGGFTPNWYVQLQGGIQLPNTPGMSELTSPVFSLNLGRNITPLVGARLGIEGLNSRVKNAYTDEEQKFKYATGSFDAMLNLVNLFGGKACSPVAFYALGGVGINWSDMATTNSSHFSPNVRLGAMLDWRVSKALSLNLEYRADNTNDQFNGRLEAGTHDWYTSFLLGVSLQIPNYAAEKEHALRAKKQAELETIARQEAEAERARAEAAQAEAARAAREAAAKAAAAKKLAEEQATAARMAAEEEAKKLNETIFFTIGKTTTAEKFDEIVEKTAEWCKKFPEKTATIDAYADKGTGTAKQNRIVAKRRATAVANAIKAKGVPADQLAVASHGDKVQPFAENDQNRCVIIVGK